jgi:serine/threonine protein kinase
MHRRTGFQSGEKSSTGTSRTELLRAESACSAQVNPGGSWQSSAESDPGRFVAINVLASETVADPDRKRCFVQEAKAASALNHPNIVTIHDITRESGRGFIAMEYVEGETLDPLAPLRGMRRKITRASDPNPESGQT